jgi:hypothetical protein
MAATAVNLARKGVALVPLKWFAGAPKAALMLAPAGLLVIRHDQADTMDNVWIREGIIIIYITWG